MTVTDIKQEYALVLATLELARQFPEVIEHSEFPSFQLVHRLQGSDLRPSPTEVVGLFTQASKFDMAQAAAKSLNVDMTNMFQSLTLRCIELSRLGDVAACVLSSSPNLTDWQQRQRCYRLPSDITINLSSEGLACRSGPALFAISFEQARQRRYPLSLQASCCRQDVRVGIRRRMGDSSVAHYVGNGTSARRVDRSGAEVGLGGGGCFVVVGCRQEGEGLVRIKVCKLTISRLHLQSFCLFPPV